MRDIPLREQTVRSGDSLLTYWVAGDSGPWLLLAGGLLGGPELWRPLMSHFLGRYRLVTWRYRGLSTGEGEPAGPEVHAQDALRVLEQEGAEAACAVGWAMGAQVVLESYRLAPQRVSALVLLGGGARYGWGKREEATFPSSVVPPVLRWVQRVPPVALQQLVSLLRLPEAYLWSRRLGLLGTKADAEVFAAALRAFSRLPVDRVLATLDLAATHDARAVLRDITVPLLAVAPGRDPLTARASIELVVTEVVGAEYLVLPDATHFMLFDHTDHLNLRIDKFLAEHGIE